MNCEICNKSILNDSQFINGKYYHNSCVENLTKENRQLKERIEYLERSIELEQEKVPYTNEYVKKLEHKIQRSVDILKKHLEAKTYDNHKYELFGREYLEDLLKILDAGEKHEQI